MPEFGAKPLSNTLMGPDQPDQKVYPKLHLDGADASVVPVDLKVGAEFPMMVVARLSSTEFAKDGARSVTLEVLEGYPDLSEFEDAPARMFPSMSRGE